MQNISLKIFVRDDIWRRITESGFAEASHITRVVTIKWDNSSLLNLAVRRLLNNDCISQLLSPQGGVALGNLEQQRKTFYKVFPQQIDVGQNNPDTFEWVLGRTKDGTGVNTPRELIHFLTEIRNEQIKRLERGEDVPSGTLLFERVVFKAALSVVSDARLNQTLLAEYPELRVFILGLKEEKTSHTPATLARIWQVDAVEAQAKASLLVSVGFFEQRGTKTEPQYWVPFIYRDALGLIQGRSD